MNYTLRKALDSDIEFLLKLRAATMEKYLEECRMPTTREAYLSRILHQFEHAQIIMLDSSPIGLFKVAQTSDSSEWYLIQIQILPDYQNQKIASSLITDLIDKAKRNNKTIGLSVIKSNPAQYLYLRLGFEITSEKKYEYLMRYTPKDGT